MLRALAPATFADYSELARRRLPRQLFDYIDGGSYQEVTLRDNTGELDRLRIRQQVLRDVSRVESVVNIKAMRSYAAQPLAPSGPESLIEGTPRA